jgi:hypothetical protein
MPSVPSKISVLVLLALLINSCEENEMINELPFSANFRLNEFHSILAVPGEGFLIAGTYGSSIRLIHTTPALVPLWERNNYPWGINMKEMTFGSTGYIARVTHLFMNDQGNYVCVVTSMAGGCVVDSKTWIVELNDIGGVINQIKIDGGGFTPYLVVQCMDGGFLLKGYKKFIKLNRSLEMVWEKAHDENDYAYISMVQTDEEQYAVTGTYNSSQVFLRLLDPDVGELWTSQFVSTGYQEAGFDLRQMNDKGYLIAGRTMNHNDPPDFDGYLIRTDVTGDTIWTRSFGDRSDERFRSIIYTDNENLIIAGNEGYPLDPDEKTILLKIDLNGQIIDTSYMEASSVLYHVISDQFIKIQQTGPDAINFSGVNLDEIFR